MLWVLKCQNISISISNEVFQVDILNCSNSCFLKLVHIHKDHVYVFLDSHMKQILEEKEQLEGQVNFLNSLIVDMQRKNDELKSAIEISEMGNVSDDTKANM